MLQSKKINHKIEIFFALIIFAFIAFRDILDYNFGGAVSAGIVSLLILALPYTKAIPFLFFILPFTCGVPGYTVLLAYIIILAKARHKNIWQFWPPMIIGLLEFTHIAFSSANIDLVTSISFLSFITLFFFLLFDNDERIDKIACIRMFIYGSIAVLVLIYAGIIINNGLEDLITGSLRQGSGMGIEDGEEGVLNGHLALNANSIAYYSITTFSLLLLGYKWLKIPASLYGCLIGLSILTGVFTFSRTWMLLATLVLLIYLITTKHKILSFSITITTVLFILFFYSPAINGISEVFLGRFDEIETAGGRTEIFAAYNKFWLSKISYVLFGAGAMCYKGIFDYSYSMHNGLQQIYVSYGLIGIVLFIVSIHHFIRRYNIKGLPIIYYLPFFACFIFDQSIQFWDPYYLIFPFLVTAYALRVGESRKIIL